jgi:hypothetical protein
MVTQKINLDFVRKAHAILHTPGQQVEIRVLLKEGGAMSGRFDDETKMIEWLQSVDEPGVAVVWWSIQQLIPEPATNGLQHGKASGNDSVAARNGLIVDVDPVRDSDPASDAELYLACEKTNEVLHWLHTKQIQPRLAILSGNGFHIYIATDGWPNDGEHNGIAKSFIGMLSAKFSDGEVKIDTAPANPGRLGKVPGCIIRKGDEEEDRPHRMVGIEYVGNGAALTAEAVKALIDAEGHSIEVPRTGKKASGLDPDFDIYDFAEWCGVTVEHEFEKNGCTYYALEECPMAGHRHRGSLGKTCFIIGDSLGVCPRISLRCAEFS